LHTSEKSRTFAVELKEKVIGYWLMVIEAGTPELTSRWLKGVEAEPQRR
jgi:hypothetical protein